MTVRRRACRPHRKLLPGSERFELVIQMLRDCLSPEGKSTRRPRSGGIDRRGRSASICVRRRLKTAWCLGIGGDLIKGKNNASAVGTLVERTSGYLMLIKMYDVTATSAVEGFSAVLNRMPLAMRKSMTYDQGREMARQVQITQKRCVAIYFCDPHSPWQRGSVAATKTSIS